LIGRVEAWREEIAMNGIMHSESHLEMKWRSNVAADRSKHQFPQLVMQWISIGRMQSGLKMGGRI
jgi:hypothetical protein